MLFNSLEFVLFLLVVIPLHAILRGRIWQVMMVIVSYIFYGWANPYYCLLLLFSTILDYNIGKRMASTTDETWRKRLLIMSLIGNLGILGLFKYSGFVIRNINYLGHFFNIDLGFVEPNILLPVGISFYTFQTLSYTIDVYRHKMEVSDNFLSFALFVAFFPQLVAGPIERARDLLPQLQHPQNRTTEDIMVGITRILWGLTKKVVFADHIAYYVNAAYDVASINSVTGNEIILATWLFAFQIYFDFSAYSDIAIGLARIMGIHINENFNHPYVSKNVGEFWRRWHISLSTWLRDYLYIPLGGSRKGLPRTIINVLIVFFLGGLWHGANVKFIAWGLWIGAAIGIYNLVTFWFNYHPPSTKKFRIQDIFGILVTFQIIAISWVFFRANSIGLATKMLGQLVTTQDWTSIGVWNATEHTNIHRLLLFVAIVHFIRGIGIDNRLVRIRHPLIVGIFWAILLIIMFTFHATTAEQFIYFQF